MHYTGPSFYSFIHSLVLPIVTFSFGVCVWARNGSLLRSNEQSEVSIQVATRHCRCVAHWLPSAYCILFVMLGGNAFRSTDHRRLQLYSRATGARLVCPHYRCPLVFCLACTAQHLTAIISNISWLAILAILLLCVCVGWNYNLFSNATTTDPGTSNRFALRAPT